MSIKPISWAYRILPNKGRRIVRVFLRLMRVVNGLRTDVTDTVTADYDAEHRARCVGFLV
jgi:hypothetical protein